MLRGINVHNMWNAFKIKKTLVEAQDRFIPHEKMASRQVFIPIWCNCSVQNIFNEMKRVFPP